MSNSSGSSSSGNGSDDDTQSRATALSEPQQAEACCATPEWFGRSTYEGRCASLVVAVNSMERDVRLKASLIRSLKSDNKDLKRILQHTQVLLTDSQHQARQALEEVETKNQQIFELQRQLTEVSKEKKRLLAQLRRGTRLHHTASMASIPVSTTPTPLLVQQMHKERKELRGKISTLEESNLALQHISEESVQVVKASNDRIEELSNLVADLEEQLTAANEQLEIQRREIEGHSTTSMEYVESVEQRCEEAINDRAALKQRLKHAEHEVQQLSSALQARDERLDRMGTELQVVKQENEVKTQRIQYLQQLTSGTRKCRNLCVKDSDNSVAATTD